jgi:hypothetical protein
MGKLGVPDCDLQEGDTMTRPQAGIEMVMRKAGMGKNE